MDTPIIYEDELLLVLDKPAGMVVNKSESTRAPTLQDWLAQRFGFDVKKGDEDKNSDFFLRAGIVHRIDKETSGLLIVAKEAQTFLELQRQFKEREVVKKYIALVHGVLAKDGIIRATVGRLPWNRERFGVLAGGREAETSFKLIETFRGDKEDSYSLVEVTPHTGRTHQIRIHFKYVGHPLVSDPFYGGRKLFRRDRLVCSRLFLHATYIRIKNPAGGEWLEFKSQLPDELNDSLKTLRGKQ